MKHKTYISADRSGTIVCPETWVILTQDIVVHIICCQRYTFVHGYITIGKIYVGSMCPTIQNTYLYSTVHEMSVS